MNVSELIRPGNTVFLIGIGGVSMSALAEVLHHEGLRVSGYDRQESDASRRLVSLGIPVAYDENPSLLDGADAVVRTAAARDGHPLVLAARARGLTVFERAQAWGALSERYRNSVCIAGTHGKTTTTGMFAHIALTCADPSVMLGGTLPVLGAGHRVGGGDMIVLESCEYTNSFHHFRPTIAAVLNVEEDHLDFFKDFDEILDSFAVFCRLIPENGRILLNADDPGCKLLAERLGGYEERVIWFGTGAPAFVTARNTLSAKGVNRFDIYTGSDFYARAELRVPGRHNIQNALAAAAAAYAAGLSGGAVTEGLAAFTGTGRRMELLGTMNGIPVYDDYAHHPTEIAASISALRELEPERLLLCFQPHTYSRTKALFDDFAAALSAADLCFLAEIYAARESNPDNLSSAQLAAKIPGCVFAPDFETLGHLISEAAKPGDVLCVMGAGDIRELAERRLLP